jgi:hypothetical protein
MTRGCGWGGRVALVVALFCLVLVAGASRQAAAQAAKWTVMVYLDGDNDLEDAGIDDINEMEQVGSSADLNILVQFDRSPWYDTTNGDWTGTRRYRIVHDTDTSTINSTLLADLGEVNMGNPDALVAFAQWAIANYPADHYLLILWDHGSGWKKGPRPRPSKGVCYDDTSGDYLATWEVAQALSQISGVLGRKLDILAYDACLMQMAEVAYQDRNSVSYQVGSEETIPWDGFPYDDFLAVVSANPTMSPAQVCQALVNTYCASYNGGSQGLDFVTMSAVDLSQIGSVATAVSALGVALAAALDAHCPEILGAQTAAQTYLDEDFKDLRHVAELLLANCTDADVQAAAAAVMSAVDAAVIASGYVTDSMKDSTGLSIYYPLSEFYDPSYQYLPFASDTQWDEFIALPRPCSAVLPDAYEPDDLPEDASTITIDQTQVRHWFHCWGDADWVEFSAEAGRIYGIGTKNLGPLSDTVLYLFAPDGLTLLASDDDSGGGLSSLIQWQCPASGTYYAMVCHYSAEYFGLATNYDLFVARVLFSDVSFTHWAHDEIAACVDAGIVSGYPDGTYQPAAPVTRDQMAVFIARAIAGGDAGVGTPAGPPTFPDVQESHWAYRYVEYIAERGITSGYPDHLYHPEYTVDRGQMAVFVARAVAGGDQSVPEPSPDPTFADVTSTNAAAWCYKYVEYIAGLGITSGYPDHLYHPEYTVDRGQMAVYVVRALPHM